MNLILLVYGLAFINRIYGDEQCPGRSNEAAVLDSTCSNEIECESTENHTFLAHTPSNCENTLKTSELEANNTKELDKHENNIKGSKPCAARTLSEGNVVCVCNITYCDDFEREEPEVDQFVSYTTSMSGLRFEKTTGDWSSDNTKKWDKDEKNTNKEATNHLNIQLEPDRMFQKIEGFGGAVTDAAGINWRSLKLEKLQQSLIDSYFSDRGLQYNMIRVPIGGSDFSTYAYAYNELPENDTDLSNYTLTSEDFEYKIPMIKAAMSASETRQHIVASTWSPPLWMKTDRQYGNFGRLKPEFFQTYALYHLKFLEKYNEQGIPVRAITTTNEPLNGLFGLVDFNSLGWTIEDMGKWISTNLGPTIRNSSFKDVKILACDDQRFVIPFWYYTMSLKTPEALNYVDGYAVHFYANKITSPSVLDFVTENQPDKFIINTEASEGFNNPWYNPKTEEGFWQKTENYISNIIEDLNYNVTGWIDWNLCLDSEGGPNWVKNFVDSPITVLPDTQEFIKNPTYYVMGHFSRFIPRGSRRIKSEGSLSTSVHHVAFATPRKTMVVVIYNKDDGQTVSLELDQKKAHLKLPAKSITTVELPYK